MSDTVVIIYNGEPVSVPKEVADFLEQDRKREQAQGKQDERHLSKSEFETVLSWWYCVRRPVCQRRKEKYRKRRPENDPNARMQRRFSTPEIHTPVSCPPEVQPGKPAGRLP